MNGFVASVTILLPHLAAAAPYPLITRAAVLQPRQDADPALLGWVSRNNATTFSDRHTCDFPATLSVRDSLAQCCQQTEACNFYSTCSAGTLIADWFSESCDTGYCNTAVIVETPGAVSGGQTFLGCWPTSLGEEAFTLVKNTVVTPIATSTGDPSSETEANTSATDSADSTSAGTATEEAQATPTGAAERARSSAWTNIAALFAALVML